MYRKSRLGQLGPLTDRAVLAVTEQYAGRLQAMREEIRRSRNAGENQRAEELLAQYANLSQEREDRLREVMAQRNAPQSAQDLRDINKKFADLVEASPDGWQWREQQSFIASGQAAYLCTVISAKEDRFGRHYLMDAYMGSSSSYGRPYKRTNLILTGAESPLALASVYTDSGEEYSDFDGNNFIRQHGGPGARIHGGGLGALAYMTSAFAAYYYGNLDGTASPETGEHANRSGFADRLWDSFQRQGITNREEHEGEGREEETEVNHCERIRDRDYALSDGNTGYIRDDEVCADVTVEWTEGGEESTIDFLPATALIESPFLAFMNDDINPAFRGGTPSREARTYARPSNATPDWKLVRVGDNVVFRTEGSTKASHAPSRRADSDTALDDKFDAEGRRVASPETCELLVRAYHGKNTNVIFVVADVLHRCGTPEQLATYLARADVAEAIGQDARLLELLGQRRLPGVAGLSDADHRRVMHAARFGSLAEAIAANPSNPLGFRDYSSKLKKALKKFDLPDGGVE